MSLCSLFRYSEYREIDKTKELRAVSSYLSKKNISSGYATFWNANILTELSNGYIEVYSWSNAENLNDINQLYAWLQLPAHAKHPEGRIFTLFTKDEYNACPLKPYFDQIKPFYNT